MLVFWFSHNQFFWAVMRQNMLSLFNPLDQVTVTGRINIHGVVIIESLVDHPVDSAHAPCPGVG